MTHSHTFINFPEATIKIFIDLPALCFDDIPPTIVTLGLQEKYGPAYLLVDFFGVLDAVLRCESARGIGLNGEVANL